MFTRNFIRRSGGFVTVEGALVLASITAVLLWGMSACAAVLGHMRCIDAAREAARLAARSDQNALQIARRLAPEYASISLAQVGDYMVATVVYSSRALPGINLGARAVAVLEEAP